MEQFEGFFDSFETKAEATLQLQKINFDFEKYNPVLVQFKLNKGIFEGAKYLYAVPKLDVIKSGDLVLVPVGSDDNFSLAKVHGTLDKPSSNFNVNIKRVVKEIENNDKIFIRTVALVIGNKNDFKLRPYFENLEKDKKRKAIMEKLDEETAKAQKVMMYKALAESNPEIKKLLNELNGLEK